MKKKSIEQQLPEKTEKPSLAAWVKKNWPAILAFFLLLCVYAGQLLYANVKPETEDAAATGTPSALTSYEEAVVVNVSQDEVQLSRTNNYNYDDLETGKQVVLVRITTGDHAGELREVTNNVSTFNQIRLKTGDKIVVIQTVSTETGEFQGSLQEDGLYLKCLRFFNKLYQEGLLDPNSMSQTYDVMGEKVKAGGTFWSIFNYAGSSIYNIADHLDQGKYMYTLVPDEATPIV